jgi:hypothetical protein
MTLNPTLDRTLKLSLTWLRLIHPLRRSYMDRKNGKLPTDSAEDPFSLTLAVQTPLVNSSEEWRDPPS